jgi:Raf kinase inhibitor-like YbhB/YbcL family protein
MKNIASVSIMCALIVALLVIAGCSGTGNDKAPLAQTIPSTNVTAMVPVITVSTVKTTGPTVPVPSNRIPVTTSVDVQLPVTGSGDFSLKVDGIVPGSVLPDAYACGKKPGKSPDLSWQNIPTGTKSLAVIVDDPDAPNGLFTHWILYNLRPNQSQIEAAQPNVQLLPNGAGQGINSGNSYSYFPACPPFGPAHRYVFTLYALDSEISISAGENLNRQGIDQAMSGHVIQKVSVIATFKR